MDREGARVHVPDRVDQAHHPAGAAQVEAGQCLTVGGQVEERVTGQHRLAVCQQPVVQQALLLPGRAQVVPDIGAAAGRAQPGEPQLGAVAVGECLEGVHLGDVVPGAHDGELEVLHPGRGEVLHGPKRGGVRTGPAHRVVDLRSRPVEGDLHVDVVVAGQPAGRLGGDADAVGGELHADVVAGGVVQEVPEVGADGGFSAADVDVEDLHGLQLVDDGLRLARAQLARVAPSGAGQAVRAGQVAGVGEFPGQADRRGEAVLEQVDQPGAVGG